MTKLTKTYDSYALARVNRYGERVFLCGPRGNVQTFTTRDAATHSARLQSWTSIWKPVRVRVTVEEVKRGTP